MRLSDAWRYTWKQVQSYTYFDKFVPCGKINQAVSSQTEVFNIPFALVDATHYLLKPYTKDQFLRETLFLLTN